VKLGEVLTIVDNSAPPQGAFCWRWQAGHGLRAGWSTAHPALQPAGTRHPLCLPCPALPCPAHHLQARLFQCARPASPTEQVVVANGQCCVEQCQHGAALPVLLSPRNAHKSVLCGARRAFCACPACAACCARCSLRPHAQPPALRQRTRLGQHLGRHQNKRHPGGAGAWVGEVSWLAETDVCAGWVVGRAASHPQTPACRQSPPQLSLACHPTPAGPAVASPCPCPHSLPAAPPPLWHRRSRLK